MKLIIDTDKKSVIITHDDGTQTATDLYGKEAFALLSRLWIKTGWALKYSYDFTWLGRPLIQLPEDVIRMQELIWNVRPDLIIETGVAHGGSAVFYAGLLEILGRGRVVSVDIEIRPHNRSAIEAHPLSKRITLIERSSTEDRTLQEIRSKIGAGEKVLVVLDSNHARAHVLRELELYSTLVTPGSYIVATDGIMFDLDDVPGGRPEWRDDNPKTAAEEFLRTHPEFELDPSYTRSGITYWPGAYLRREK